MEIRYWKKIIELLIPSLNENMLNISGFALAPDQVVDIFKDFGYEDENWDEYGFNQDTSCHLVKEGKDTIVFSYSGYYGDKWLSLLKN